MTWIRFRRELQQVVNRRLTIVAVWLLAVASLAGGCSMTSFGYGVIPTWAMWQLDSWLDLDDDQRALARARVDQLHVWHRTRQLPQYAAFFRAVDDKVRSGMDVDDVARWRRQVVAAWQPFAREAAPAAADLLMSLKPEQIARLRTKMVDANRKWAREHSGSEEKVLAARHKRYAERAEFFFGDLTREQLHALHGDVTALPPNDGVMLAERQARQQRLLALIERLHQERPAPEVARKWSEAYLLTLWESPDRGRQAAIEQASRASDALSVSVWSRTSEAQRRHLSGKLREFAEQATVLASAK